MDEERKKIEELLKAIFGEDKVEVLAGKEAKRVKQALDIANLDALFEAFAQVVGAKFSSLEFTIIVSIWCEDCEVYHPVQLQSGLEEAQTDKLLADCREALAQENPSENAFVVDASKEKH